MDEGRRADGAGGLFAFPRRIDPAAFSGAPLDAIKCAAAVLMVGDHVDTILLDGHAVLLWRLGRIAFPLFCLVLALHLARGADPGRYVLALLVLAVPVQAVYAAAFPYGTSEGNILFTLAAGAALSAALARAGEALRH
ncbi:TraX family protein, partial [Methylobacterium trifolii]